ncbi:YybH family protein [Pedobacter sp.]|uniref:YybH family protein n=1 Tax=Pedobacter sp. TaxID=1411316 RepID=UPI00396D039D
MNNILIVLLLVTLKVSAQSPKDREAILNVLEQQRQAWNKGDVEKYMQGYWKSDSLLFVGKNGPTYGWQKTLDNYKKGYPDKAAMGVLTFGIKKVEFLAKDKAFVLGSWHLQREKDEPKGYFTLLLKKINGLWKVIVDHSS